MKIIDTSLDAFNTEIRNGKMKVYLREGALDSNINGNKLEMVSKNEGYILCASRRPNKRRWLTNHSTSTIIKSWRLH